MRLLQRPRIKYGAGFEDKQKSCTIMHTTTFPFQSKKGVPEIIKILFIFGIN
jgi:hypothetical protein